MRKYNTQTAYITNINFAGFDRERKQWDICFIRDNKIYMVSISEFTKSEISDIINSFRFLK
jgi:hypothetical protein